MASEKVLAKKQDVINEIKNHIENSQTVVVFTYKGLTDDKAKTLRRMLRDNSSDYKVYKNTLMNRAFTDLKIDFEEHLQGSSALAYGNDSIAPIKALAEFAKKNPEVTLKVGIVDKEISDNAKLMKLSVIPNRDTLLNMLASGLIEIPKKLAICLDLYAKQKNNE